jgi:4-hydroxy-tetrahydrodipicolinate synthase
MWRGCLTALLTPFRGGEIDFAALERLVDAQVAGGVQGVVPCGSTGESATLTHDEHIRVVEAVVRFARGRVPVIAGTGSNSTAEAVRLTRAAEEAGAAGALLLSPYYNKPTQEGIYQHYAAVAEATKLPIVVYNIPGRTASNILPETIARLSHIENIVGVKEASGSMQQVIEIIAAAEPGFAVWSGDDVMTLPIGAAGGAGAIAVSSNIVPGRFVAVTDALLAGDFARARDLMYDLLPLVRVLTMRFEVNPIPVKTAAAMIGLCAEEFRLPLTPMSQENRAQLERVLREYALVPDA